MRRALFASFLLLSALGFTALGIWQVHRLAWKQALIATTTAHLHAAPIPAPAPATPLTPTSAYTRVTVTGEFLNDQETQILAVTKFGRGYWVLTPLQTGQGFIVLVNRGWVPSNLKNPAKRLPSQPQGSVTITGLLRLSEPHGAFLRTNHPAANQWYSRDVAAIAQNHNLSNVAPYFIDADATGSSPPIGGLTVITFANNHLSYALTWFILALMALTAALCILWPHYLTNRLQRS